MRRLVITLGLATGLLAFSPTAALASGPPYTVTVGSSSSGTHSTALTASSAAFAWGQSQMTCSTVSSNGTVIAGPNRTVISTIAASSWSGCSISGLGPVTVTQQSTGVVSGTGATATTGTADYVDASVSNVNLKVSLTSNPAACTFSLVGAAQASFDEAAQRVNVSQYATGPFKTANVTGCTNVVAPNLPSRYFANYTLTSPAGVVRLS